MGTTCDSTRQYFISKGGAMTDMIVVYSDPKPRRYHHVDVDGDRLGIFPAVLPDGRRGVNIRTDSAGSTVLKEDIPALIEALNALSEEES